MTRPGGSPAIAQLPEDGRYDLYVLGIAQDGGRPHAGCTRACCTEARRTGKTLYPVSLGVRDRKGGGLLLVEASPAVEAQLALLHRRVGSEHGSGPGPVDAVLITHAHIGHYLGLAQFGREVADTDGLPVFVSARMAAFLRDNAPWSQLVELREIDLRVVEPGTSFHPLPQLDVTAVPVPHRDEFSDTVAFQLRGSSATVLFVPDVDRWDREPGLLERLLEGVDIAYLDATFYDGRELPGRNLDEIPHALMADSMDRLAARAAEKPGTIRFLHFNHTNPALDDVGLRAEIERRGFGLAAQGEHLRF